MSSLRELQWNKFPVLDDGFVTLVDVMGTDQSVVQAARVSYGRDQRLVDSYKCPECGEEGKWRSGAEFDDQKICWNSAGHENQARCVTWTPESNELNLQILKDDRKLIRYLMRHRHTTPFEMVELKFLVRVPMDCWRQWIRHRTASVNEYSTRYTEAIDARQTTKPEEWRLQSTSNKQGSSGFLDANSGSPSGGHLSAIEEGFHQHAFQVYQYRIDAGVAKEQARKDLPLSTYTEAYWKIDLHNLFHFLGLRMHSHAQKEIRDYATTIGEKIVKPMFPMCWEAFEDYRLNGMFLTGPEIEIIKAICAESYDLDTYGELAGNGAFETIDGKRERKEAMDKLTKLGILSERKCDEK